MKTIQKSDKNSGVACLIIRDKKVYRNQMVTTENGQ